MSAATGFAVDFLLTPSVAPSALRRNDPNDIHPQPSPRVESVDALQKHAEEFNGRLSAATQSIAAIKEYGELEENLIVPIRLICHGARELTERVLARGFLEEWKPEGKSIRTVAVRYAELFKLATDLMGVARTKLVAFQAHDAARLIDRYVESMHARMAIARDIAFANDDGVRVAVLRIWQQLENSKSSSSSEGLAAWLRLGEKFVSSPSDHAFLSLTGRYRVFAAMSLVQNLTAWVSELEHEAGPYWDALPAHRRIAESIYDCVACIVERADHAATTAFSHEAEGLEEQLKRELNSQLEKLFQTYDRLQKFNAKGSGDTESQAEKFLREIALQAHEHLAGAVAILRESFESHVNESRRLEDASSFARVLVFQSSRYREPELKWAAHALEFNLVAYAASSSDAIQKLRELVIADLAFRDECGLEPEREVDATMAHNYEMLDTANASEIQEWNFKGRSVRVEIQIQPTPAS
jgi:hypothetical protein